MRAALTLSLALARGLGCDGDTFVPADQQRADRFAAAIEQAPPATVIIDPAVFRTASTLSHGHLDAVLRRYLTDAGNDYLGLASDPEARRVLDDYRLILAAARPESMTVPQERLAFWLNAYTALVLAGITERVARAGAAVDLSADDFALFTAQTHEIAGFTLTLEQIEHLVLRGDARYPDVAQTPPSVVDLLLEQHALLFPDGRMDPRVNFGVSFGTHGFPPMPRRAYRAETLDAVLEARTRAFINDPDVGASRNGISILFEWFVRDFALAAGSVDAFIARYYDGDLAEVDTRRSLRFSWTVR
jgi:hypothetical protein